MERRCDECNTTRGAITCLCADCQEPTLASLLTPSEAQDVESLLVEIALSLRKRPYLLTAVNKLRRALRERAKEEK